MRVETDSSDIIPFFNMPDTKPLLDFLISFWNFINLQPVSNVATLLGTGISCYLLITVKSIRKDFLFAARLPQFRDGLQSHASNINLALTDFEMQKVELQRLFEVCNADLKSLTQKLSGSSRKELKKSVMKLIDFIDATALSEAPLTKENTRAAYAKLNGLIQQLINVQEDQKWSARDAG